MKRVNCRDLEVLVFLLQLTYHKSVDILDVKYIAGSAKECTLAPSIYEVIDINLMLETLLHKEVKVNITIEDGRLRSNITTKRTIRSTGRRFFYIILGLIQPRSCELRDIPSFIQLIPGSYNSDKPINITGIDKVHLKANCIKGSIVNGTREPIFYSFDLSSEQSYKIFKEPRNKLLKKK